MKEQVISMKTKGKPRNINLSKIILEAAFDIAVKIEAKGILVIVQSREDISILMGGERGDSPIVAVRNEELFYEVSDKIPNALKLPNVNLTRMGQIKVAVMLALSSGMITPGDILVCVTGISSIEMNDSVVVLDTGREFEIFSSSHLIDIASSVRPDVFETVLNLAMELTTQGREGRAVGTIFVLGDEERVLQLSRQLIINPFKGYSEDELNIHNAPLREAIKEFSMIDGAFVIRGDGVLITAGRHLNAALEGENLPPGLGSRHVAAAGITSLTNAIAIVVSESTGSLRIFKNGKIFMEIERPSVK